MLAVLAQCQDTRPAAQLLGVSRKTPERKCAEYDRVGCHDRPWRPADRLACSVWPLLALVLAPPLLGVPLLAWWSWGNEAHDRPMGFKISLDLVTAHEYWKVVKSGRPRSSSALANPARLASALRADTAPERRAAAAIDGASPTGSICNGSTATAGCSPRLRASCACSPNGPHGGRRGDDGRGAHQRRGGRCVDAQPSTPAALRRRPTCRWCLHFDMAVPDRRSFEDRGMIIHAAAPVYDDARYLIGVSKAACCSTAISPSSTTASTPCSSEGLLPLGSLGTATLFSATPASPPMCGSSKDSARLAHGSLRAVRDQVLGRGPRLAWHRLVVNEIYVRL